MASSVCEQAMTKRLARQTHPTLLQRLVAAYDACKAAHYPVEKNHAMLLQRHMMSTVPVENEPVKTPPFGLNIGGQAFEFDEADVPRVEDNVLRVRMTSKGASADKVPATGRWVLTVGKAPLAVINRVGMYDFSYAHQMLTSASRCGPKVPVQFVTLRIPVVPCDSAASSPGVMGVTELLLTAELCKESADQVILREAQLVALLKPDEKWYGSDDTCVMGTTAVAAGPYYPPVAAFVRPSESRKVQRSTTANEAQLAYDNSTGTHVLVLTPTVPHNAEYMMSGAELSRQFISASAGGADANQSTMVVVGTGGTIAYQAGPDAEKLVRLGQVSAPLSAVALRSYHAEHNSDVRLDAPKSASALLRRTGATHVAEALDKCYARAGMSSPSMNQLLEGSSGLPNNVPISRQVLQKVQSAMGKNVTDAGSAADDATDDAAGSSDLYSAEMHHVASVLSDSTTPLGAPGTLVSPSHLAYTIARATLPQWETEEPEQQVAAQLASLGMGSATFTPFVSAEDDEAADQLKPLGASYQPGNDAANNQELLTAGQGVASLSAGLYATPADIGKFFSDTNPWYASLMGSVPQKPVAVQHAHMATALEPKHTLFAASDDGSVCTDALGMVHSTIAYHNFPLRVASAIGCAQAAQTLQVSVVPRLHSVVVFTSTATPNQIAGSYQHKMKDFSEHLVGFALDQVHFAEKFMVNDEAAAALVEYAPDESDNAARLAEYNHKNVQHFFSAQDLERHGLTAYIGKSLQSVAESLSADSGNAPVSTVTLTTRPARQVYGDSAPTDKVTLMLTRATPGVGKTEQPIAFDRIAIDPHTLASGRSGALRAVNPATANVGEFVTLAQLGSSRLPTLLHAGGIYCHPEVINQIKCGHASNEYKQRLAEAPRDEYDPYAPARGTDVADIYKSIGGRRGRRGRRGHGRRGRSYRRGSFFGGLLGGAAASLFYPTVYYAPPYGLAPFAPGYYRPRYLF